MTKIKLEHIDKLRRGKKSGAKIGSRGIPHHLFKHEEILYENALKNKYLEVNTKSRVNLQNLWYQVCKAKNWKNYVLIKNTSKNSADILCDDVEIESGKLSEMKAKIKTLI